jgi:NADH dehydrogenase [ubiquinone] 1 alpha subcomplex assembly factor 7
VTPLERALRDRIAAEGPITVETFMEACNAYYYATRDPFGAAGDFTTAPEISQMFGEMVGACLADAWFRAGKPPEAAFVELGPGRGTLAADALRVLCSAGFSGEVHFVEASPILREMQKASVPDAHWHESIQNLPDAPLLLVANEFLDALPIRQMVHGTERRITVLAGGLAFDRDGEIIELSPAREAAVATVAEGLVNNGGIALFIDYGHDRSGKGDTLQAVRRHGFTPVLANPGEQDLTSHVDFEAVARFAIDTGAQVTPVAPQGEWLSRLGIEARAETLARTNPDRSNDVASALERLTSPDQMGQLFKVIAIHSPRWPVPAGFA